MSRYVEPVSNHALQVPREWPLMPLHSNDLAAVNRLEHGGREGGEGAKLAVYVIRRANVST